jgi:amidophosphoribosyltransferase
MCGIVGIVGFSPVNQQIYDALTVLQHRGQDAAGIMTAHEGELFLRKDNGLVRDVFQQRHMLQLKGNVGIGHVRYPTAGCDSSAEAQPFYVNAPYGICLAHNGNLTNAAQLADVLIREDRRHLNTSSDSEVLLNVLASELQRFGTPRASASDIFAAVSAVYRRIRGAYAVVAMVLGHGVLGFRDPNGIRPLVIGTRENAGGREYMLASESVALDQAGYRLLRDVGPGEAVFIDERGRLHSQQCAETSRHAPCIFEYVYFARPDSIIDNISVYKARLRMGELLAEKIRRERPDHDIDVVIPIPDTSRTRTSARSRCATSSMRSTWSSAARTCCWSTTRSFVARPRRRSSRLRGRRARGGSISRRPHPRCGTRTSTASTCPLPRNSWRPRARNRRSRGSSAPTGSSTRTWTTSSAQSSTMTPA